MATATKRITFVPPIPWAVDVSRPGGRYVRYLSDPRPGAGAGIWRTERRYVFWALYEFVQAARRLAAGRGSP